MGGKQSSSTTVNKLPPAIEEAAEQNLKLADEVAALGYTPYTGPTVAALAPGQMAAMGGTNAAAQAFGLPYAANPFAGLPQMQDFGGLAGYSPMDLYSSSINALPPAQRAAIESFIMDPFTGAPPTNPAVPLPGFLYGEPGQAAFNAIPATSAQPERTPMQQHIDERRAANYSPDSGGVYG